MHVVIAGCGQVGSQLAKMLAKAGHDVAIIDKDSRAFRRLGTGFNGLTVTGNAFDQEILLEANIGIADAFAAVTNLDNTNMMAAQVAKTIFHVPNVIGRLYSPDREDVYEQLGLDLICGTRLLAIRIRNRILQRATINWLTVGKNAVQIIEFTAPDQVSGRDVADLDAIEGLRILALQRQGVTFIVRESMTVNAGDQVFAAIETLSYDDVIEALGLKQQKDRG